MSAINRIAYYLNRRDEVPNQELAHQLAETEDKPGIHQIAENLWNKNKSVRSDCLKVLYEIGYIRSDLIADYVDDFLKLLKNKENRMVWGAMIGLTTISDLRPHEIWRHIDDVIIAINKGSLITVVWGVKTLAHVAAADKTYNTKLFPFLLNQLQKCIPRDVSMHAESMLVAVDNANAVSFLAVLEKRKPELTPSQFARLNKVIKKVKAGKEKN
jgi:hypothetical protein